MIYQLLVLRKVRNKSSVAAVFLHSLSNMDVLGDSDASSGVKRKKQFDEKYVIKWYFLLHC